MGAAAPSHSSHSSDHPYKPFEFISSGKNIVSHLNHEVLSLLPDTKKALTDGIGNSWDLAKNFTSNGRNWLKNRVRSLRNVIGETIIGGTSLIPFVDTYGRKIGEIFKTESPSSSSHGSHGAPAAKKSDHDHH